MSSDLLEIAQHHIAAGQLRQAQKVLLRIVGEEPCCAKAFGSLGVIARQQNQSEQALAFYAKAIECDPADAELLRAQGECRREVGQLAAAIESFEASAAIEPECAQTAFQLGDLYAMKRDWLTAKRWLLDALRLDPKSLPAQSRLGDVLCSLGQCEQGLELFQAVQAQRPDCGETAVRLAMTYQMMGRLQAARRSYERGLQNKNHPLTRMFYGQLLLLSGDYEQGWEEFEWRLKAFKSRAFRQPRWNGQPDPNLTVLLHAEQGLGDTIQFARFASLVKRRVGRVIVECQRPLVDLLRSVPGVDEVVEQHHRLPTFDAHLPLLSQPWTLQTIRDTLPGEVPYLRAPEARRSHWRDRIGNSRSLRVGINWQGNPNNPSDERRSIPLAALRPMASIPDVRLFSLQREDGTHQLDGLPADFKVVDLGRSCEDSTATFADLAGIVENLDLVITCDTAIAHLAGALGANVWIGLAMSPDWRWGESGEQSAWYPTAQLFRQTKFGCWESVIASMGERLSHWAARHVADVGQANLERG